jgi:subfamily B ATP-binding cassette protein MsbA
MVRQAPLLLLDEPTVALDAQAEQIIVQALERLMVGRTTLVIAHRLSTIQRADLVLVIDNGRIVEAGTPAELMAACGHYYQLYTLQFQTRELASLSSPEHQSIVNSPPQADNNDDIVDMMTL